MLRLDPRDFVDQLTRILDLRVDYEEFCRIWSCIFTETLIPESIIEGLAARYRLLLLSNTNAIHFEMIRRTYPAYALPASVSRSPRPSGATSATPSAFCRAASEADTAAWVTTSSCAAPCTDSCSATARNVRSWFSVT